MSFHHPDLLRDSVSGWNYWRSENPDVQPELWQAWLMGAELREANLSRANLDWAEMIDADLRNADLTSASMHGVDARGADFSGADLTGADLSGSCLLDANLDGANLTGCRVWGVAAWNTSLNAAIQKDLIITKPGEPTVTVDRLEVAQFIYLILNNQNVRDVMDTITSRAVLLLGRFSPQRKAVLEALRTELRQRGFVPIIFDFDRPANKSLTETVSTLAHMSRFVIADVTDARSVPHELKHIVPQLPSLPVQMIISSGWKPYAMIQDLLISPSVLPIIQYDNPHLSENSPDLASRIISRVNDLAEQLRSRRAEIEASFMAQFASSSAPATTPD